MNKKKLPNALSLDWGKARVGVAIVKDSLDVPILRDPIKNDKSVFKEIGKICKKEEIKKIVVGLPKELDGSTGPSAGAAHDFGEAVQSETGVRVEFFDERFSSTLANAKLRGEKIETKKNNVDSIAALEILEGWMKQKR